MSRKIIESLNPELYERLRKIEDSDEFFEYFVKPLRVSVRVNTLKADLDYVVERLSDYICGKVPWCREGFYFKTDDFSRVPEHQLGVIISQEASSMIPVQLMELKPGMKVLDLAASPGVKTTQIAQYMENDGCIVANDVKMDRVNILISNLQRLGVLIATVTMRDGRYFRRYEDHFDAVLIDAPCSNIGMVRKNYKYAKLWNLNETKALSRLQKDLIFAAYKAVKPKGIIVYSTCTVDPLENEEVVDYLLKNAEVKVEKINIPVKSSEAILEFEGKIYDEEVRKCLRIHPQNNDSEAFFVAKLRKLESS